MIVESEISEKYRKYLISFIISGVEYFSIWGTDLEDEEIDKLVLNSEGDLILSTDFNDLRGFLLDNEHLLFDKRNFLSWLKELKLKEVKPYASYNLNLVEKMIDLNQPFLRDDNKEMLIEVFDFFNLFSDLAYQKNDSDIISIYENKNNQIFVDYIYTIFFWNSSNEKISDIKKSVKQEFDEGLFIQDMRKLFNYFVRISGKKN